MATVKHYKMYEYKVNSLPIAEGQIIYTIDTGKVFLDISEDTRIQVTNIYKIESSEKDSINPITNGIYHITDKNEFYFYDGQWNPIGAKDSLGNDIAKTYIKDVTIDDASIKYTKGDGSVGSVGFKGKDGAKWFTETSVLSDGGSAPTGSVEGDIVLDSECNLFKVSSTLTLKYITNIQGEQGPQGEQGIQGEKGDPGDKIRIGESYDTSTQVTIFFKAI